MNEEQRRILNLLAEGKITADQAESLLDALQLGRPSDGNVSTVATPKFLRVMVEEPQNPHGGKVNVRVPISLIRAGVRLAALLPTGVTDHVNKALRENGLDFDVSQVKPENLEELVEHLRDLTVDVEGNRGEKVRVFCE